MSTAAPAFADRDGRRHSDEGRRHQGGDHAQRPGAGAPQERAVPREQVERRGPVESNRGQVERRGPVESYRGPDGRADHREFNDRERNNQRFDRRDDNRGFDNRRFDNRGFDNRRFDDRRFDDRRSDHRGFDSRLYYRPYSYRPYTRTYVYPYGYHRYGYYGYRSGWNLNLYFGRPYGYYGYPEADYGYYSLAPGRVYGAVRIVDAPRDAQVFVDGYFAGVVDDYDGVFQHLNLEAGPHRLEIEYPGYPPVPFDVHIEPGRTITLHANLR